MVEEVVQVNYTNYNNKCILFIIKYSNIISLQKQPFKHYYYFMMGSVMDGQWEHSFFETKTKEIVFKSFCFEKKFC